MTRKEQNIQYHTYMYHISRPEGMVTRTKNTLIFLKLKTLHKLEQKISVRLFRYRTQM